MTGLNETGMMELVVNIYGSDRTEKARLRHDGNYGMCHHCHRPFIEGGTAGKANGPELVYIFDKEGYASCAGTCYDEAVKGIFPSFFVVSREELSNIMKHQKRFREMQERAELSDMATEPVSQPSRA